VWKFDTPEAFFSRISSATGTAGVRRSPACSSITDASEDAAGDFEDLDAVAIVDGIEPQARVHRPPGLLTAPIIEVPRLHPLEEGTLGPEGS
jgi:hypothetical protein